MKKIITLIMALIMIMPMNVKAMNTNEVVKFSQEGIVDFFDDFSDGDYDDFKYVKNIMPFLVTFRPTSMRAKVLSGTVKVKGNFTTACVRTVIQVSKRADFKDAVNYTFSNPEYRGNVTAQLISEIKWYYKKDGTKGHISNKRRIVQQNGTSLSYRMQPNLKGGEYLPLTSAVIDDARKKVCSNPNRTLTLYIKNGTNYRYRARNIYEYNNRKYYSPWTEFKAVR